MCIKVLDTSQDVCCPTTHRLRVGIKVFIPLQADSMAGFCPFVRWCKWRARGETTAVCDRNAVSFQPARNIHIPCVWPIVCNSFHKLEHDFCTEENTKEHDLEHDFCTEGSTKTARFRARLLHEKKSKNARNSLCSFWRGFHRKSIFRLLQRLGYTEAISIVTITVFTVVLTTDISIL